LGTCHRLQFAEGEVVRRVIHRSEYAGSFLAPAFFKFGLNKMDDESRWTR